MPPDVASTGPPLARSSRLLSERRLEGLLCGALFVLFVIVARLSPGTFADDDIGRFFSAQVLFQQPEKLLGLWTRPAAMLLYALPSQLGYGTVEVTTALVATATCWLAIGVARRLGEPQPLWAGLLTGLQPFFVLLSFSVLTEPLAALLLVASLERALAGKWKQSALWAALLPLARLELLLVSVVWSVWYLRRRAWSALLILPLGILLWHLAGWMTGGDPLYLAHQVFVDRERVIAAPGFLHYARGTIFVLGPVVFFFAALGLVRAFAESEVRWIATAFVVMFVYYSWSAWQSGSLQSGGHLRHLVALAPLAGVLAARGQRVWLIERPSWKWTVLASAIVAVTGLFLAHGLRSRYLVADDVELWKPGIVGGLFLLGLARRLPGSERWGGPAQVGSNVFVVLALLGYFFVKEGPLPLNIEERIMHDVALVCHDAARNGRPVLCNHPSFFYFLGMNPYRDPDRHALKSKSLAEAPLGSLLVWEGHYGPERAGG
ncbi:MAG: hypothetical protein R3E12_17860, partial [Candidatus Eisenbacteria bacterium]